MATPTILGTDLFSLGGNFHVQSSSSNHLDDASNILDASGNVQCETMIYGRTEYSVEYRYCNGTPDIATDLGSFLTTFGKVANSIVPTGMTITFQPGEYATVSIQGVQYDENAIGALDIAGSNVAAAVPASAGFGVPTLTGVTLGDAEKAGLTLTFSCNHVSRPGGDGNHFISRSITYRAEGTAEYVGIPTTWTTVTGWTTDSYDESDSNQDFEAATWTGHRHFDSL